MYATHFFGSAVTDDNGSFNIDKELGGRDDFKLLITLKDVDGKENGGFYTTKHIEINVYSEYFFGGEDNWYDGRAIRAVKVFMSPYKPSATNEDE